MKLKWKAGLLALAAVFMAGNLAAQPLSQRTIRVIVPFAPGGATDYMGRAIAQKMGESLGQTVVVENKPGANGIVGTDAVAKATPDGHTLVLCAFGHATNPYLVAKLPYDTLKDLAPVSLLVTGPLLLVTHPSLPVTDLKSLVAYAKANPGKLNFASGGIGSSQHFAMELLTNLSGTKMTHIAYKGTAPAYTDLLAGTVPLMFDNMLLPLQHVKAGKLRAIAVSSAQRAEQAPDIPTVAEAGIPGYDTGIWHGFLTTAGTPKAVVDRLNQEVVKALNQPDVKQAFVARGLLPVGNSPEQFDAYIRNEMAKWSKVIKEAGIQAQ
ncbi:MAG TPA: tripartite tricarboxylate transporter substrate binding protein [Burkholderiales bacterium]